MEYPPSVREGAPLKRRVRRHTNPFNLRDVPARPDWAALFGRAGPIELEIGFGGGKFLLERARQAPGANLVGLDVRRGVVEQVKERVARAALPNVHVMAASANAAVEPLFAAGELARVYVFFPDPWFKKRHHKRRVITEPFVRVLHARMAPGAELHLATDQEALAAEMLALVEAHGGFENLHGPGRFAPGNTAGIETETESYYRSVGQPVWYAAFRRLPSPASGMV